jgi:hypothetical protein
MVLVYHLVVVDRKEKEYQLEKGCFIALQEKVAESSATSPLQTNVQHVDAFLEA